MILVDTSIWADHFRGRLGQSLSVELEADRVLVHPWVLGELALGELGGRKRHVLADLELLPAAPLVSDRELRAMLEARKWHATGIGWVDLQVLASALVGDSELWTRDRKLLALASDVGIARG
jgi:predicted nucleic acid-binding protein